MNRSLLLGLGLVVVLVGAVLYGAARSPAHSTEVVRIGAVLSFTGDAAADALNIKRGIELAKADLAKEGVVIEIEYQDDKTDPKQTVSALQYLLATHKPQAIIGPTWSFLESAAAPVIASSKIIAFAPADTSEFADVKSPYQFHGAPLNALATQPVAAWIQSHGVKRVAIIVNSDGWSVSVDKSFRDAVALTDATVVFDETIQSFSANAGDDMALLVTRAKAANVDLILWTGYEPDAVALAQTRTRLNYLVPVIAQTTTYDALLSRKVITPGMLENMYFASVPTSQAFVDKFTAAYGEAPGNYAERAYDSLRMEVDAIQHAKSQDADTLAAYLRSKPFKGFAGTYEFNEKGDPKGGEWVIQPVVR